MTSIQRLLLLGANGQLGSDLCKAIRSSEKYEAIELDRDELNVCSEDEITRILRTYRADVLINCSAYTAVDDAEDNSQHAMNVNARAVGRLAEVCAECGWSMVHISTDYAFDGSAGRPYREDDCPFPLNVYGATKLMGEALARIKHYNVLIFRVASLFGVAGASGKGGNFVETMIRVGREKGQLRVVNDQFMSPTYTADVAEMILKALHKRLAPGIYHAVNAGRASWYDFACRIIERAGVEATVEPIPSSEFPQRAQRPAFSVLDNSKLASQIGDIPPWEDALDRYLKAKGHL